MCKKKQKKKNDGINAVICGQRPNLFYVIIILNCYFGAVQATENYI